MIKVENITKSFGDLKVLKGINMKVKRGEILSITGPSGAGKTTLLQIIGSLDKPDTGRIIYNDTDITTMEKRSWPPSGTDI